MTTKQEIEKKLQEFRLGVMPDASSNLLAGELSKYVRGFEGYSFAVEPTAEATLEVTCIKGGLNLDWTTRFQAHNLWNKDVAKKGNVLVSKLGIKKKISKNWNIKITAEVKL